MNFCRLCNVKATPAHLGPADLGLHRCDNCGLVFLPAEDAAQYADEAEQKFFSSLEPSAVQRFSDRVSTGLVLRRIQRFRRQGSLLEIGIGNGSFLKAAARSGYDCVGVEPSSNLAEAFTARNQVPVFTGTLQQYVSASPASRFDIVIMNHVLEHIPDPLAALRQIRSLLTPDGLAHIAVPNIDAWEAHLSGWTSYEPYHLYYFSSSTVSSLAAQAGLRILRQQTREPFSGWTNALARTVLHRQYQDLRPTGNAAPSTTNRTAARAMLDVTRIAAGAVTLPFRHLQAHLQRGEELITIMGPA